MNGTSRFAERQRHAAAMARYVGRRSFVRRARRRELFTQARRVLAPGGVLIVYEPRWPNPRNRHTQRVARRELRTRDGDAVRHEAITLLPLISRRLGERGRALARIHALRSHRLTVIRAPR